MKHYRSFLFTVVLIVVGLSAAQAQQFQITPLLDCIEYNAATNMMTAHFGYDSRQATAVTIVGGGDNRFVPPPPNRGQVTLFQPGLHQRAFSVTTVGNSLLWIFNAQGLPVIHLQNFYCKEQSNRTPAITPILTSVQLNNSTGQATATFGYFSASGGTVPKGSNNYFSFGGDASVVPYPGDRGQPTQFQAGFVRNAFQVTFNPATEPAIIWNLSGQTIIAVAPTAPTAASVGIGGRVLSQHGRSLSNARLTIINTGTQEPQQARSNAFGHYRFSDVQAGETYLLEVRHKSHNFSPQILQVFEDVENLDLAAEN